MLRRAIVAVALVGAAVALGALTLDALGGGDTEPHRVAATAPRPAPPAPEFGATPAAQAELREQLEAGVAQAGALGAEVQAAAWIDGQPAPVIAGTDLGRRMRLWSMSKPFAAIAALRAIGSPEPGWLASALDDLLLRSENCPMRELMVELQRRTGSLAAARQALAAVFRGGGGGATAIASEVEPPDPECRQRLEADGIPSPDSAALLMGTSTWTIEDAVRMTHSLASGDFGAQGERVLALMRRPKSPSGEIASPDEYTADPAWGAGRAYRGLDPAYKAGWGGTLQGEFMVGQLAIVPGGSRSAAIAVMAHPDVQPSIDDPGRSDGPRAVETVLRAIRPIILRLDRPADWPTIARHGGRAG